MTTAVLSEAAGLSQILLMAIYQLSTAKKRKSAKTVAIGNELQDERLFHCTINQHDNLNWRKIGNGGVGRQWCGQ